MIRRFPWTLARSRARSCVRNMSRCRRRVADRAQPHRRVRLALGACGARASCRRPGREVRMVTGRPPQLLQHAAVGEVMLLLGGGSSRSRKRNSVRYRPMPSAPVASSAGISSRNSMLPMQPDPDAVGGDRRVARAAGAPARARPSSFARSASEAAQRLRRGGLTSTSPRVPSTATTSPGEICSLGPPGADHRGRGSGRAPRWRCGWSATDVGDEGRPPGRCGRASPRRPGRGRGPRSPRPPAPPPPRRPPGPCRLRTIRSATKSTSARRSRKYSSAILSKSVLDLPGHAADRPLGVDVVGGDDAVHLVDQHRVAQHQPVRLEDERVVLAVAAARAVPSAPAAGARRGRWRSSSASARCSTSAGRDAQLRRAHPPPVEHEGAPHGQARAGADALDR